LEGSLVCNGHVEVLVDCGSSIATSGLFSLHAEASIRKPVKAGQARIEGTLEGSLELSGELDATASARIRGVVKAGAMRLAPGTDADLQLELGPAVESSKFDSPVIAIRPAVRSEGARKRVEIDLGNL
jgi:cytoskeletal protein CcmA (bactofilin family)